MIWRIEWTVWVTWQSMCLKVNVQIEGVNTELTEKIDKVNVDQAEKLKNMFL